MPEQQEAQPAPTPVVPGDLIQVVDQAHEQYRAVMLASEVHGWGVGATMPALLNDRLVESYHRLRRAQLVVVGTAFLMPPEVLERRRAAVETARLVAAEARS